MFPTPSLPADPDPLVQFVKIDRCGKHQQPGGETSAGMALTLLIFLIQKAQVADPEAQVVPRQLRRL